MFKLIAGSILMLICGFANANCVTNGGVNGALVDCDTGKPAELPEPHVYNQACMYGVMAAIQTYNSSVDDPMRPEIEIMQIVLDSRLKRQDGFADRKHGENSLALMVYTLYKAGYRRNDRGLINLIADNYVKKHC